MDDPESISLRTGPLALLHRVSRTVSSGSALDFILDEIVALAVEATACDACLAQVADPESGDLVLRAWRLPGRDSAGEVRRKAQSLAGAVVAVSKNAAGDARFEGLNELGSGSWEAALSAPLAAAGATFGILTVHHRAPRFHSPGEIALVTFLGEQMGCAIERDRLALENAQLREEALRLKGQLELRKLIERAKGVLQRQLNLTEEQAYLRLRNESRRLRRPMAELARAILLNGGYPRGEASRAAG